MSESPAAHREIDADTALREADRVLAVGCKNVPCRAGAITLESCDPEEVEVWAEATIRDVNTKTAVVMPDAWRAQNPEAAARIIHTLEQRVHHARINHASVREMSATMAVHFLQNLPRLATVPTLDKFAGHLKGKPAVIVSAGPSLDKNRHLLPEAYGKAAVFAVNTSANAVPGPLDGIVSVEHKDVTDLFRGRQGETTHFLDITANPKVWDMPHQGQVAMLNQNPPLMPYMAELRACPVAYRGGVAGAALAVAHWMGADPIILVGQDLAWTDGRCYSEATPFADLTLQRDGDRIKHFGESKTIFDSHALDVEAWGGGTVLSSHIWEGFRMWFAEAAKRPRINIINCTEGGARIPGTKEAPLRDVLRTLPKIERPDFRGEGSDNYKRVIERLQREAHELVGAHADWLGPAVSNCIMSHMWIVPAVLHMNEQCGLGVIDKSRWIEGAQRSAGAEILRMTGGPNIGIVSGTARRVGK